MSRYRWAAVAVIAALAVVVLQAPARAEVGAVVHTWFTGPATVTAGGAPVEARLHLRQEPGSPVGFVMTKRIAFQVVPPGGAAASALAISYQYFGNWRPVPIDTDRTLGEDTYADIRVAFGASAGAGLWKVRVEITSWVWTLNGVVLGPGYTQTILQHNDWFEIRVGPSGGGGGGATTPAAPQAPVPTNGQHSGGPAPATAAAPGQPADPAAAGPGGAAGPSGTTPAAAEAAPADGRRRRPATAVYLLLAAGAAVAATTIWLRRRRRA